MSSEKATPRLIGRENDIMDAVRSLMPYLDWQLGPESPGNHPMLPSAVQRLRERIAFADGAGSISAEAMAKLNSYIILPLPADEGGGYVAYAAGMPGCMSDGETPEDALSNLRDAITCWEEADKQRKDT